MQRVGALCAATLVWSASACASPPVGVAAGDHDAVPPAADAGVVDARPTDAAPPDACVPYVHDDDAGPDNPRGIRLSDITFDMPEQFLGGRTPGDNLAFGSGVALADLDGDGDLEVILARNDRGVTYPGGPASLLENQGGFHRLVPHPGFAAHFVGGAAHAASTADYDRDGDLDVFIGLTGRDVLLRNDGGLSFTDVTAEAGVGGPTDALTSGGIWADVNHDGLTDLYVTTHTANHAIYDERNANRLYLNRGDGSFRDVTDTAGVGGNGSTQAALIGDLDDDGDLEIYVANDRFAADGNGGFAQLDGDKVFDLVSIDDQGRPHYEDRSQAYGITDQRSSMGLALADIDHDGILDVYITDFGTNHVERWNPAGPSYVSDFGYYGLNVRAGPAGDLLISWGARFVDLDRDGWLEAFVVNGPITPPIPCAAQRQPDFLFRSEGGQYRDISVASGLPHSWDCPQPASHPIAGRGVVTGDIDLDGDDDLIIAPYIEAYRFIRNDSPRCERPRARMRWRGTASSAEAVGATVEVELADGRTLRRPVYAGGDTYSQSARALELPLPVAVVNARIRWPSGVTQAIPDLDDGDIELVEPAWLTLEPRTAAPTEPAPAVTLTLLDADGQPRGPNGAGAHVVFQRSDDVPAMTVDRLDGSYVAFLPHAGQSGHVTLTISVGG